ncbi:MAG: PrsW family intramembrane metalloprotease [Cyanobacteria bacterium P01_A01_bin.135]
MSLTNRARVLYGSPLSQPKVAKFTAIALAVLVVICLGVIAQDFIFSREPDQVRVFFLALLWSALFSVVPIAILWFLDRREQESRWLYVVTFLWGALVATGVAIPINTGILSAVGSVLELHPDVQALLGPDATYLVGAPLAGPIVEEITKGIALLLLFWLLRAEFDSVRDGFIYGALIGVGFNFLESAIYVASQYSESGIAPWGVQLGLRHALFGFGGHALFTGLFGLGLGLARQTVRPWLRYAAPIVGWLMGFSAHLVNNLLGLLIRLVAVLGSDGPVPAETDAVGPMVIDQPIAPLLIIGSLRSLITLFPFFVAAIALLWQSGIWERQVIREGLADEGEPVVTPEEYDAVKADRILRTRQVRGVDKRTAAAIARAQDELALRKWRLKHNGQSVNDDPLVASWREELAKLRGKTKVSAVS